MMREEDRETLARLRGSKCIRDNPELFPVALVRAAIEHLDKVRKIVGSEKEVK